MPCAFNLDDPLRVGKGCQFGVPENELIMFNDEMWCEFHCPLKGVKANWNETQIESNPSLTDQQKQQLLQMMQQSSQSVRAFVDASSADVKAVKPFVAEIDSTFSK